MSEVEVPQVETPVEEVQVGHPKGAPIESRFLFVDVAALRAKQLRRGARVRLENVPEDPTVLRLIKPERMAMEEVRENLVQWNLPDFKVVVDLR
jgi:DNA-directed RNA polymerase subunit K/omega